jgi:hypothetical protein
MTSRTAFTDEEWATLRRAPLVAGMAITLADPGGPIEVVKETSAVLTLVKSATDGQGLVGEVARDLVATAQRRENPLGDFRPQKTDAPQQILAELSRASGIASEKATPEEAGAYASWLVECARRAAQAAKEGGFLGFHAVRVSEGEQRMIAEVAKAVGATEPAAPAEDDAS